MTRIKICGNTEPAGVRRAVELALLDAIARSPDDTLGAARRFVMQLRQAAPD